MVYDLTGISIQPIGIRLQIGLSAVQYPQDPMTTHFKLQLNSMLGGYLAIAATYSLPLDQNVQVDTLIELSVMVSGRSSDMDGMIQKVTGG